MQKFLTATVLLLTASWAQANLTLSQTFSGTTLVNTLGQTTSGVIPDGNPVGVAFLGNFNQAGNSDPVLGVSVGLSISGGYNGDLYAYLVAPNGTVVVLMNQPGTAPFGSPASGFGDGGTAPGYGAGTVNSFMLTASGTGIQTVDGTPGQALTGSYMASGLLGSLITALSPANGNWKLFFADLSSGGGTSTLNSWTLNLTVVPEPVLLSLILFLAMLLALAGLRWAWRP